MMRLPRRTETSGFVSTTTTSLYRGRSEINLVIDLFEERTQMKQMKNEVSNFMMMTTTDVILANDARPFNMPLLEVK